MNRLKELSNTIKHNNIHILGVPEEEEERIKEETKATIRCIPLDIEEEEGVSLISGKPSKRRVLFAKAY